MFVCRYNAARRRLLLLRQFAKQGDLIGVEWYPIRAEQVVEPNLRLRAALLRAPGKDRVRLAGDEAPIEAADAFLVEDRQVRGDVAVVRAGHPFGADHRPDVLLDVADQPLQVLGGAVVMKRDDVDGGV